MTQLLLEFVKGGAGLIAAIGALLGGAAALLQVLFQVRKTIAKKPEGGVSEPSHPRRRRRYSRGLAIAGGILLSISFSLFATRAIVYGERPLNEELTTAAWKALSNGDFQEAKAKAQECIKEFGPAADREEAELKRQSAPPPPKGRVTDVEAKRIFSRGLLNDVATSYFILGKASEGLGETKEAIRAYERAKTYSHARTWDPKGWFWSPAEGAEDRLGILVPSQPTDPP